MIDRVNAQQYNEDNGVSTPHPEPIVIRFWQKQREGSLSGLLTKAALDYSRYGWSVIPIESRGKSPLLAWDVYQHRRTEKPEFADWFERWPQANLAIVTGTVSSLVVLDVGSADRGAAALEQLWQGHAPLPETVEVRTGAGGRHLYFAHYDDIINSRLGIVPGVDLYGDGSYVVAPPSVHANDDSYSWIHSPEDCRLATLPDWLAQMARDSAAAETQSLLDWQQRLGQQVGGDEREKTIAYLAEHLAKKGVDQAVTLELMLCWNAARCHPPMSEEILTGIHAVYAVLTQNPGRVRQVYVNEKRRNNRLEPLLEVVEVLQLPEPHRGHCRDGLVGGIGEAHSEQPVADRADDADRDHHGDSTLQPSDRAVVHAANGSPQRGCAPASLVPGWASRFSGRGAARESAARSVRAGC